MNKVKASLITLLATTAMGGAVLSASGDTSVVHASTIKVANGDTLWGYSQKYHVSLDSILKENNIELGKYTMWDGDSINIPDGKKNTGTFTNHFVTVNADAISKATSAAINVTSQAPAASSVASSAAPSAAYSASSVASAPASSASVPASSAATSPATTTSTYSGTKLTPSAGTVVGPSGKETYYNLDMSTLVANAHNAGISGSYWVRSDGAKMLGDYVMVAANLGTHARYSTVATSLGTGIVVDTGSFITDGSGTAIDVATTW